MKAKKGSPKKTADGGDLENSLSGFVAKLLKHTKDLVTFMLDKEDVETQDPFSAFMTASKTKKGSKAKQGDDDDADEDMEDDESDSENDDNEILSCY